MKIAAFNKDGTCGCMADTVLEVVLELQSQGANLADYTFYHVNDNNPFELSIDHKQLTKS